MTEAKPRQAEKAQASLNRLGSWPDASRCDRISENVWMNLRPLMTTYTAHGRHHKGSGCLLRRLVTPCTVHSSHLHAGHCGPAGDRQDARWGLDSVLHNLDTYHPRVRLDRETWQPCKSF